MDPPDRGRPTRLLFIGDDASSPQIAAALLRLRVGDQVAIETAGTHPHEPGGKSDELLVAMGLDPTDEKPLRPSTLYAADTVVVLGTRIDVARLPGPRYEEWDLERDDLAQRVVELGVSLLSAPAVQPQRSRWAQIVHRLRSTRLFFTARRWMTRSAHRTAHDETEEGG